MNYLAMISLFLRRLLVDPKQGDISCNHEWSAFSSSAGASWKPVCWRTHTISADYYPQGNPLSTKTKMKNEIKNLKLIRGLVK